MAVVTFWLLSAAAEAQADESSAQLRAGCDLAAQLFRQHQRMWVYCQSQQDAEDFDELLWKRPVDSFVPHNLAGEGSGNSPVQISWHGAMHQPSAGGARVLINMAEHLPAFAARYPVAYDFVPVTDHLKTLARQRYKQYRAAGFQLHTLPEAKINEITNGKNF